MKEADKLAQIYQKFRLVGIELEEFIDANTPTVADMTELDTHRLDKCSVVLKMGFKQIKMILKSHGLTKLKQQAKQFRVVMEENKDAR
jgi:hypothetical protein